jgi:hypothetical protein
MSDLRRWRDSGHLERAVGAVGGQAAFDAAVSAMLENARDWRLAELRQSPWDHPGAGRNADGCLGR